MFIAGVFLVCKYTKVAICAKIHAVASNRDRNDDKKKSWKHHVYLYCTSRERSCLVWRFKLMESNENCSFRYFIKYDLVKWSVWYYYTRIYLLDNMIRLYINVDSRYKWLYAESLRYSLINIKLESHSVYFFHLNNKVHKKRENNLFLEFIRLISKEEA